MKNFTTCINEKIKLTKDRHFKKPNRTKKEILEDALPDLEVEIKKLFGNESNKFDLGLTVEDNGDRLAIRSGNLVELGGCLAKTMFKEVTLITWGGHIDNDSNNQVMFTPKFSFQLLSGGSNGTDALWYQIVFDFETETFKFGNVIKPSKY